MTHGKHVARFAILSKRENAKDWGTRNDRLMDASAGKPFEARHAALLAKAEEQVRGWMAVEPLTQFRIEDRSF